MVPTAIRSVRKCIGVGRCAVAFNADENLVRETSQPLSGALYPAFFYTNLFRPGVFENTHATVYDFYHRPAQRAVDRNGFRRAQLIDVFVVDGSDVHPGDSSAR